MAKDGWRELTSEIDMRPDSKGGIEGRFHENDREAMAIKAEVRKETEGRGIEIADGVRQTASIPLAERMRMDEQYGSDPDAQAAFLRDNPQHCLAKDAGAPARKNFFFLKDWPPKGAE